jgi:small-conductance mechanosensitive channel
MKRLDHDLGRFQTLVRFVMAIVAGVVLVGTVQAQQDPPPDTRGTDPERSIRIERLEELVADLEDETRRKELVDRLRTLIEAAKATAPASPSEPGLVDSVVAFFQRVSDQAGQTVSGIVAQIETIPSRVRSLEAVFADGDRLARLADDAARVTGVVFASILVLVLTAMATRRVRRALSGGRDGTPLEMLARAWRLVLRLCVDLVPPALAVVVGFVGLSTLAMSTAAGAIALAIVWSIAASTIARRSLDAIFAPNEPGLRLLPLDDTNAKRLARSLGHLLAFAIHGFFTLAVLAAAGADVELLDALRAVYALGLLITGVTFVLRHRRLKAPADEPVERVDAAEPANALDPTDPTTVATPAATTQPRSRRWSGLVRTIGRLWWVAALVYMFGLYGLWVSGMADVFGVALQATGATLLYVTIGVAVILATAAGLRRIAVRVVKATRSMPSIQRRVPRYLAIVRVTVGVLVVLVVTGYVFEAWRIQPLLAVQATLLNAVLSRGIGVLAIVLVALALIDASTALTEAFLARKARDNEDSAKLRTLVPLSQKAIKLVVWTLTIVTVMGQVGISIGPILASIGVLGLAIGFGAQTLVKDVITGVFILLEDAVSVGDVVRIDGTGGVVEAINIRTIRLRDLSGVVHTIPYSSVGAFANMTKDFSYYLVECSVSYRENVDEVSDLLRKVGDELKRDPKFGPRMLAPIEIIGLDRFEESAVIVRARLKTLPGSQWDVGREFNRRMKQTFDEHGIEIPFPHQTIYFGVDKHGKAPPMSIARAPREAKG